MSARLWVLASAVAAVYTINDLLVVTSDRGCIPWGRLVFITIANAAVGPAWWAMWRIGGAMRTTIALDVALSLAGLLVVAVAKEPHTPRQWACFVVILVAAFAGGK